MKTRHDEMQADAIAFHKRHPEIWILFERFAFDRIRRGFKHYSARGIWHRIRWETAGPSSRDETQFKLSDHHTPFYARQFMIDHQQHAPKYVEGEREAGFFRTKRQISRRAPALGEDASTVQHTLADDLDFDRWSGLTTKDDEPQRPLF